MAAATLSTFRKPQKRSHAPIRVMLVDDSLVVRSILARILGGHREIEIIAEADSANTAIAQLHHISVDLILLDIEMPYRSGLEALPELLERSNEAEVLIVSSFAEENGPAAIEALSLGACDTLAKPGSFGYSGGFAEALIDKVLRIGQAARRTREENAGSRLPAASWPPASVKCVAIGSSTGGLPAIHEIVGKLDPALAAPILITQHLPETFMPFFARQLAIQTQREVRVAEQGEELRPGIVYIAPGDAHLSCRRSGKRVYVNLRDDNGATRYRPSVDVMFDAVAECFGDEVVAIMCSGMGQDGAEGAHRLYSLGATVFAQNAESSVVWGMPGAVVRNGDATAVLSPTEIAALMADMVRP